MEYTGPIITAKCEAFIGAKHENCYLVRGMNLWWGAGGWGGGGVYCGDLLASGSILPSILSPVGKAMSSREFL